MTRILCCALVLAFGYSPVHAASKYEDSLRELAEGVAAEAIKMKKSRLAVLDFADNKGDVTPIGQFLAEELSTQLLVAGELKVVDHKLLAATMAKHQLTHLDTSQAKAAKKVAKALRADLFVTGSYLEIPEGVRVTAKLIGPYTVFPVGAARAIVPKAGPLAALFKQANAPKTPVATAEIEPAGPVLSGHENEWYKVSVVGLSRQDDQLALDLLFVNRSSHPIKLGCQLRDTYLLDEHGEQWPQDIEQSRETLCTRGMELYPRKGQPARLLFSVPRTSTTGPLTLHYHETSPRPDRVVSLDGLTVDTPAAAEAEPSAPQESVSPAP